MAKHFLCELLEAIGNCINLIDLINSTIKTMSKISIYDFVSKNIVKIKILSVILFYIIGVSVYSSTQGWDIINSIYFVTVTVCTVGYGYFHIDSTNTGVMWFTIFFILIGCPLALYCINEFARNVVLDTQEELIYTIRKLRGITSNVSAENMRKYKLALAIFVIFILTLAGSLFYSSNEGWSGTQALYWVVCTMTTVGYGDLTVTKESTRVFAIFFILSIVTVYAVAMNNIFDIWVESFRDKLSISKTENSTKFDERWVQLVLTKHPNGLTKDGFIIEVLMEFEIISFQNDIKPILEDFRETAKDGLINEIELSSFAKKMRNKNIDGELNPLHNQYTTINNDSNSEMHVV